VTMAAAIWSWLGLWLILVWGLGRGFMLVPRLRRRKKSIYTIAAGLALFLVEMRWFGYPLSFWSASLMANFSIVLISLLFISILEAVSAKQLFRARDWRAAWYFGAGAALVLYPSALGLGPGNFDAYSMGWPSVGAGATLLFAVVSATTAFLFVVGNRFAWVLLTTTAAYAIQFQESRNYWDYLQDPLYAGFALLAVLFSLVCHFWKKRHVAKE
jgi:hypothetical protein